MYNRDYLTIANDYVLVHNKRRAKFNPYIVNEFNDRDIKYSKTFDKLSIKIRNFIHEYSLLNEGEKIVIAFSGGKDSVFLINVLEPILNRFGNEVFVVTCRVYPNKENIYNRREFEEVFNFYKNNFPNFRFKILDTTPFETEKTPCFRCSIYRRFKLVEFSSNIGAKKIIFGHNLDDLLETVFIMFTKGKKIKLQQPKKHMPPRFVSFGDVEVYLNETILIKPLLVVSENDIIKSLKELSLPYFDDKKFCKYSSKFENTTRGKIDKILKKLNEDFQDFDYNMFKSLCKTLGIDQ